MRAMDPLKKNNVRLTGNPRAARTLVFAHGLGGDQTVWEAVAAPFLADFRVVLFDHVGAGGSDPAAFFQSRYLSLESYANDLRAIAAALDLRDAVAVGHSVGAMICVLAALAEPRRFSRLALIGASPCYLNDADYHGGFTRQQINDIYQAVTVDQAGWADAFATGVVANGDRPQLATHFADALKAIPNDRILTALCAIFQSDYRTTIARLAQPTLIVQTRDDPAVPIEVARFMRRQIAGSELAVIDAEGHLPHLCAPEKVVAAIRDFVDAAPLPAGAG